MYEGVTVYKIVGNYYYYWIQKLANQLNYRNIGYVFKCAKTFFSKSTPKRRRSPQIQSLSLFIPPYTCKYVSLLFKHIKLHCTFINIRTQKERLVTTKAVYISFHLQIAKCNLLAGRRRQSIIYTRHDC